MAANANSLQVWMLDALKTLGGAGRVADIARHTWQNYEEELRNSADLFYTCQYAMRWAGQVLQKEELIEKNHEGRAWQLLSH